MIGIFAIPLNAQIEFSQKLDSISMLIGDQQHLTLSSSDQQIGETPFAILDTMSWLQIIDKGSWIQRDRRYERKILFTVFDSGYFVIPALGLIQGQDSVIHIGNPLALEVNNPSDSLNILRPIKSIEETKSEFRYLTVIIVGALLIAAMLFILWLFFKADRIKPSVIQLPHEKKIWEQCILSLEELESKKLWQNNMVKEYYDELNLILRTYLSSGLKIPAMENTSSEIIDYIQKNKTEVKNWELLRECFRESDYTKFANRIPFGELNIKWMQFAIDFVKSNKDLSEAILEETRVHWKTLLGESLADQFDNPLETVPNELIQLFNNPKLGNMDLFHHLINRLNFQLPEDWIKWHEMHTGIFYRWQTNILNISKHQLAQIALLIFVLPFIAVFLPILVLISLWKKQDLFSRGVFGLSSKNKLVLRKIK
jgi:hypothetical protein